MAADSLVGRRRGNVFVGGPGHEPIGRKRHAQRLVRPVGVVLMPERVDRGLLGLQVGPDGDLVEQFALQGLVEPLA
jgi:hypothetical protein